MKNFDYTTYLSPFTWRYGSAEMREIWSEVNKRKLWRKVWVALATAQHKEGLVSKEELDDLLAHQNDVDIEKAHEIEKEIRHDLMAEIKVYSSQATIGGGKIHLGATSQDIEDNADALREKESLVLVEQKLRELLGSFGKKIEEYKNLACIGYTHLQPAEPTTLGYRFAFYAQDLLMDLQLLRFAKSQLKGKGIKGAVGTSASYADLLDKEKTLQLENDVMKKLGIDAVSVTGQTSPRKIEYFIACALSSIAQSLYKFSFDFRIMQSAGFSEWQEPFGSKQVGSSAMPFKKNPIKSEQICSLGRVVFHLAEIARDTAAHMLLERTIDDSAARRVFLPEMFLAIDEMLTSEIVIVTNMVIRENHIEKNLTKHGPFAGTERVLMQTVKNGANRQEMHELLRGHALSAYKEIEEDKQNPLTELLRNDKRITKYLLETDVNDLLDPKKYIGVAKETCETFLKKLHDELSR